VKNGYFAYYAVSYSTITLLPIGNPQKSLKIDPLKRRNIKGFRGALKAYSLKGFRGMLQNVGVIRVSKAWLKHRIDKGFRCMFEM